MIIFVLMFIRNDITLISFIIELFRFKSLFLKNENR